MEKTTLYITADVHRQLQEAARREKRPQAELIREALATYLASKITPMPSSIGAGEDGEIPASEIKGWLRAHRRPD